MKLSEIVAKLEEWERHCAATDAAFDKLHELTGAGADCDLMNPTFSLLDAYTDTVGEILGGCAYTLSWYFMECNLGKSPKWAKSASGLEIKSVDSIKKLARLIHSDHKEAA